jgi:hypothetical protein
MKNKVFLIISIMLTSIFAACNKETPNNNGNTPDTDGLLNPPAWFIGNWVREDEDPNEDIAVTAHNVTVSSGHLDFTYQIKQEYLADFSETLVGDVYTLSYITKHPADYSVIYQFEPNGNRKMKLTLTMSMLGTTTLLYNKK